jgi:lipopolysaccharide/colanic/teichoic acid biosynthesis glycosyltransferase
MFQLPSAWLIALVRGRLFLLEIRDLWPDFAVEMGVLRNRPAIAVARAVEHFFYRHQDWVVINSPGFRGHLLANGVPANRLTVIANGVESSMFDPNDTGRDVRRRLDLEDCFVVTYAGSLGLANDLDTLLRAAEDLLDEPRVRVLIVGAGKELSALSQAAAQRQLRNVVFGGHVAKSDMGRVLAASDVCVASVQNVPLFRTVYPNKVFDYMAAGRPTILAIDGVIREVIEQAEAGTYVPPGDARALADAVRRYVRDPAIARQQGLAARQYACRHFERADQAAAFEQVLQRLTATHTKRTWYRAMGKRCIDLVLAATASVLLSPLILLVFLLVRWRLGAPAIFCQARAGRYGRPFTLYKFRTMRDANDALGRPLPDEQRLTPLGQRLRSLSLDELPQLWNILRGDMSLIGPRPLLVRYLARYSTQQARRHDVRPGITGWAQVNGRNAISWSEKFRLDVWYVDHCSLTLDARILWRTAVNVLTRHGISSGDHATMPEFMGEQPSMQPTTVEESVP